MSVSEAGAISPLDRLINVADTIFERAIELENIKLGKKDIEVSEVIDQTKNDAFSNCAKIWKVILTMLPNAGLEQPRKKELTIDAYKVISRCFHRLNDLDSAKKNITEAIDAGYLDGFISLGAICIDMNDFEGAETAFKSAIAKDAQVTRAHAGLGELYFAMGTEKLASDPKHTEYITRAEEEFILAGKERFAESFERAMDLFETIGWKENALAFGERAVGFYNDHRESYGEKLLSLNTRIRKLAGADRHDKIVQGVGRKLGEVLGGKN